MKQELLRQFQDYLRKNTYKEGSVQAYLHDVRYFFVFLDNQINGAAEIRHLRSLTKTDVYLFINYLKKEKGNTPITINRKLSVLRVFFDFLEEEGIVHTNLAERISLRIVPGEKKRADSYFHVSRAQLEENAPLCESAFSPQEVSIFIFASTYALTPAEIAGIKREDIDIEDGLLHVMGNNERIVHFKEDTRLKGYLSDLKTTGQYLLSNKTEKAMSTRNVQFILAKISTQLFGTNISAMALRKNAVKNYIEKHHANLLQVKEFLGLKSISAVEKYL